VTVLGGSINELEVERFEVRSLGCGHQRLAESHRALAGARDTALDEQPVLVNLSVVREATNGCDSLLGEIGLSGSRAAIALLANTQHTLVDLGTVMVTLLTGTGNTHRHSGRMPCTDTGDLAQTSVGFAGKAGDTPTRDDTSISVTTGSSANIQTLTLGKDGGHRDFLLEERLGEVDLGGNISTVDLHLEQVSNLLAELELADLGVSQHANNLAVLLDAVQLGGDLLRLLSSLLGVLREGLLLGRVPVLVESATDIIGEMVGPDGGQGAKASGGGNVTDYADDNHRRGLNDGHSLDSLLLVKLGSRALNLSHAVRHTGLVAHEGG